MSDMSTFKKIGLFGIGVLAITEDKIEELVQEVIKKGELAKKEGRTVVTEVLLEKSKQMEDIKHKVDQKAKDALDTSGVATKEDIDALKKKLEIIEGELEKITGEKTQNDS